MLLLLVARGSNTVEFGTFSIAYGVIAFGLALARSAIGIPLAIDLAGTTARERTVMFRQASATAVSLGLIVGTAIAALATFNSSHGLLLLFAFASPVLILQDVWRFGLISLRRPLRALVSDTAWLGFTAFALILTVRGSIDIDATAALSIWLGGAATALVMLVGTPTAQLPSWRGIAAILRDRRRHHLSSDAVASALTPVVVAISVSVVSSPATVGALRGAATLMAPINVALSASQLGATAQAGALPRKEAVAMVFRLTILVCTVTALWGLSVCLLPDRVGVNILGAVWGPAQAVLPITAVEYVSLSAATGSFILLRARALTGRALRIRGYYSALAVLGVPIMALALHPAIHVAAWMALSAAAAASLAWLAVRRVP